MKTKDIFIFIMVFIASLSCSKKEEPQPLYIFQGLFTMNTTFSSDPENFLFENNRVLYGNEAGSIHQTILAGSNLKSESTTYSYDGNTQIVKFDYNGKKWEGTYEPTTGRIINGVVKSSNGLSVLGAFYGQKHLSELEGFELLKGHWKGFFGNGDEAASTPYNLIIEDNGVVVIVDYLNSLQCESPRNTGLSLNKPAINGKTISCIYQYVGGGTFSIQATYNPETKKLEGTWGSGFSVSGGGKIILEPQNFN